jgi:hypothetical protein
MQNLTFWRSKGSLIRDAVEKNEYAVVSDLLQNAKPKDVNETDSVRLFISRFISKSNRAVVSYACTVLYRKAGPRSFLRQCKRRLTY